MNAKTIILLLIVSTFVNVQQISAQTDFFWSFNELNSGAVNSDATGFYSNGDKGSLYLYYTTKGPADSDLEIGAFLDITTSQPGTIRFTAAETLNFEILIKGSKVSISNRWTTQAGHFGAAGNTGTVTDNLIDEWCAFTLRGLGGDGILETGSGGGNFIDAGYDANADAFLFGRVDFEAVGSGDVSILIDSGDGLIVGDRLCGGELNPTFGGATIVVDALLLLGDVNMDGEVNLLDIQPFVELLSNSDYQLEADINGDGFVDLLDVQGFVDLLAGGPGEGGGNGGGSGNGGGPSEGSKCLHGDINLDGTVNLLDGNLFVDQILNGGNQCEADVNQDGAVNLLDVCGFIDVLIGG